MPSGRGNVLWGATVSMCTLFAPQALPVRTLQCSANMRLTERNCRLPGGTKPFRATQPAQNSRASSVRAGVHRQHMPQQGGICEQPTVPLATQPARQPCISQLIEAVNVAGTAALERLAPLALAAAISVSSICVAPAEAVTSEQLLFLEAWRAVDRAYVDKSFNGQSWFRLREEYLKKQPMSNRSQTYDAIIKLLSGLEDPFTRFLPPERLAALRRGTAGSVTGVGVEITYSGTPTSSGQLVVLAPAPGGPAAAAGVQPGDVLETINGVSTKGLSLYEAGDLLQGEEGTEVNLVLRPRGSISSRDLTLTRQKVAVVPVSSEVCAGVQAQALPAGVSGDKVGYVRVATFNSNTAQAVQDALVSLKRQGMAALLLDIRNNGGGLFPAGVSVARMLLDKGDVVLIADNNGIRDIYSADGNALDATTPLLVLINKGTASASEVLAGALKDNGRAVIAGENSFGKGLIQTIVELSDGSGVAVTVAKYQTPAGVDINKVGIDPNVRLTPEQVPADGAGICKLLGSDEAPSWWS